MPLRSYSTWTWWSRSPCGCTHQHHGKIHQFQFHCLLAYLQWYPGFHLKYIFQAIISSCCCCCCCCCLFVFCCWSRACIKFSNPCIEPHELLRRPLRSTESPFLREWQFTCPSTSSTTILNSGQNQRNLTQKGSVFLLPSSLPVTSCEAAPSLILLNHSLPSSGSPLRRRQSDLLSATSPLAGALATALGWGLPSWRLRWLLLRSWRSTHLCEHLKQRLVFFVVVFFGKKVLHWIFASASAKR